MTDNLESEESVLYKRVNSRGDNAEMHECEDEETISLSCRLSYLFGTEEIVDIRRHLVILRGKLWSLHYEDESKVVFGGSLGEGVAYPRSDDDVMICRKDYQVVRKLENVTQNSDLLMVGINNNPGYCMLLDVMESFRKDMIVIANGKPAVSSSLAKDVFLTEIGEGFIHGPCHSFDVGSDEYDAAFSIPCAFWPDVANEWLIRKRPYGWPSQEMIKKIEEKAKCHVVAIGNPVSPLYEHEWRISFLVAERMIMHSLSHSQFLTYNLLRTALKRKIEKDMKDVLCSYFMKTILFYTIENTTRQTWMLQNLEICFQTCLSMLYDNIESLQLPNYFIPQNNMIQRKVNETNKTQLLQSIMTLRKKGILGVLRLCEDSLSIEESISSSEMEWKHDKSFLFSHHLLNVLSMIQIQVCTSGEYPVESYVSANCNDFAQCLKGGDTSVSYQYSDILNQALHVCCCLKLMHDMYNDEGNEYNYHESKRIQSLLQLGKRGDVSTLMLTMANFLYLTGKTESALSTIRQLLSEYPPYVLDGTVSEMKNKTYQEEMCSKGYTLDHKAKLAWAPPYSMPHSVLNAFPKPLKILLQIVQDWQVLPITYALLLECLCYIRLEDRTYTKKAIKCLIQQMNDLEKWVKKNLFDIVCVRMCVGIIRYVQGDKQSACRWFSSVFDLSKYLDSPLDTTISHSALTYTACLIN